jgi:hypothetical protein
MSAVMSSDLLAGSVTRYAFHVAEMLKPKTVTVAASGRREGARANRGIRETREETRPRIG